jgi:L-rhamnose mutarotase
MRNMRMRANSPHEEIDTMKRYAQIIGIKPDRIEVYKQLHAAVWPAVLKKISECNMRNYSIFLHGETLFAYFEYVGADFAADSAKMAADPMTQEWWAICVPMQVPLPDRKPGEHWSTIEEVFHTD